METTHDAAMGTLPDLLLGRDQLVFTAEGLLEGKKTQLAGHRESSGQLVLLSCPLDHRLAGPDGLRPPAALQKHCYTLPPGDEVRTLETLGQVTGQGGLMVLAAYWIALAHTAIIPAERPDETPPGLDRIEAASLECLTVAGRSAQGDQVQIVTPLVRDESGLVVEFGEETLFTPEEYVPHPDDQSPLAAFWSSFSRAWQQDGQQAWLRTQAGLEA